MSFVKKNLTFTVVVVLCVSSFCAGTYLAFAQSGKIERSKQGITMAESQLNGMRYADPAPTEANVKASEENVRQLQAELLKIREDLQKGALLETSSNGIGVMAGIQQYISEYQRKADAHTAANGEPRALELPKDFAFGFEQYLNEATAFEDGPLNELLDKQRQILSYLIDKLYESDPEGLVAVEREVLESTGEDEKSSFKINQAISARVPGAIDTLAFSITYKGYTNSLRAFLNELAQFELPIVVRSIEVVRPSGESTTSAPSRANNLDALFGAFGGGADSESGSENEAQKPVIEENISTFTVVLEFIEIVLPADTAEDNV